MSGYYNEEFVLNNFKYLKVLNHESSVSKAQVL